MIVNIELEVLLDVMAGGIACVTDQGKTVRLHLTPLDRAGSTWGVNRIGRPVRRKHEVRLDGGPSCSCNLFRRVGACLHAKALKQLDRAGHLGRTSA